MNKILTTFCFLLLTSCLFAQANKEFYAATDDFSTPVPDSSELVIQCDDGWDLCVGGEMTLFTDYAATKFEWLHNDSLLDGSAAELTIKAGGTYQVRVIEGDSLFHSEIVEVIEHQVETPMVKREGSLLTTSLASSYQWFHDDIIVDGATNQSLYLVDSGEYFVETTSENGCIARSELISLTIANIHEVDLQAISTYPSPTRNLLYVTPINIENQNYTLSLYDNSGRVIQRVTDRLRDNQPIELQLQSLPAGIYFLQFLGEYVQVMEKVTKN